MELILLLGFCYGVYALYRKYFGKDVVEGRKIVADANEKAQEIIAQANAEAENIKNTLSQDKEELESVTEDLKDLKLEYAILTKKTLVVASNVEDLDALANITSEECKNKLVLLKQKEKDLISSNKGLIVTAEDDKKVVTNNQKQILRCFNAECDNIVSSLTVKSIDSARTKIQRAFESINTIFRTDGVELSQKLLEMKLEEITLVYAYNVKKEQEREQQKAIREQMVEEAKVARELEKAKQEIEKDQKHFSAEISKIMGYMQKSNDSVQSQLYADKIKELENKLKELEEKKKDVAERQENAKAGYVYIISNIGSFGEDVYKIGMTRRLEPMDRIKELGSASVPFEFDVHAMIFSDNAPALETVLHQTFYKNKVNKINERKEFFKVPLSEIAEFVKKNYNATVEFTMLAAAKEYRESMEMAEKQQV